MPPRSWEMLALCVCVLASGCSDDRSQEERRGDGGTGGVEAFGGMRGEAGAGGTAGTGANVGAGGMAGAAGHAGIGGAAGTGGHGGSEPDKLNVITLNGPDTEAVGTIHGVFLYSNAPGDVFWRFSLRAGQIRFTRIASGSRSSSVVGLFIPSFSFETEPWLDWGWGGGCQDPCEGIEVDDEGKSVTFDAFTLVPTLEFPPINRATAPITLSGTLTWE